MATMVADQEHKTPPLEAVSEQLSQTTLSSQQPLIQLEDIPDELPPAYEAPSAAGTSFRAEDYVEDEKVHLLLAATGSVATIKIPEIIRALGDVKQLSIRVILTKSAQHFLSGQSSESPAWETLRQLSLVEGVYTDEDEWNVPWTRGESILHIELRKWADVLLIAPLDANTLAKITNGLADNLLTSVVRAWDSNGRLNPAGRQNRYKYLVIAPAMNTAMWLHPVTKKQLHILTNEWAETREFKRKATKKGMPDEEVLIRKPWAKILQPGEKELACGDRGLGAMIDWREVVAEVKYQMQKYV